MTFQENRNIPSSHPGHGQGPAGASLSDLLTAVKNVASNVALLGQIIQQINGTVAATGLIAGSSVLKQGAGRIASVSVVAVAGSTQGYIVDANNAAATGPVIYLIPGATGLYVVNLPFSKGLVVNLGTGMAATVSYS